MSVFIASTVLLSGLVLPTIPPMCIAPTASGAADGSSWENAGSLSQLNGFIAIAAATGAQVWLRADAGTYSRTSALTISNGGPNVDSPVIIRGVDANGYDAFAEIVGNRASPWSKGLADGNECFRMNSGANNLFFKYIRFRNQGRGCFRGREVINNFRCEDIEAFNVNTFFSNDPANSASLSTINGFIMRRCYAKGFSKTFARIQGNTNNGIVEDCEGDSDRQDKDNFASGFILYDTAHSFVFRRCTMGNIIDTVNVYQNGDAFSGERGNHDIQFYDCLGHNCTDAGWDFKGDDIQLYNCISRENHRSYRFWGYAQLYNCQSIEPIENAGYNRYGMFHYSAFNCSMLELFGCSAVASTSKASVFSAETGARLAYDSATTWSVPSGAYIFLEEAANNGDPPGMILARPDYTTAPTLTSPTYYTADENFAAKFVMESDRPIAFRIVGGRDRAKFSVYGNELRMKIQDYEALSDPSLQVQIQLKDMEGNLSSVRSLIVAVQDLPDDPITPDELFAGAVQGLWYEIGPDYCWADAARTVPCTEGSPIYCIDDRSGNGLHARPYFGTNEDLMWIYREEGGRYFAECSGVEGACYKIGTAGCLNFGTMTITIVHRRDPVDMSINHLFTIPRFNSPDGQNSDYRVRMYFAVNSGTNFGAHANGTSYYTNSSIASPLGKDAVLSYRTAPGILRSRGADLLDGTDIPTITYSGQGIPVLGGRSDGGIPMIGRFYGMVIVDDDLGQNQNYRVERQLGLLAAMNI